MQHTYVARDYSGLVGMPGFNEALLRNHFKLYEGYVKNVNRILADLEAFRKDDKLATPAAAELRRRLGWEFDGMRLHEIYFDNLGGKEPLRPEGKLGAALVKQWGSIEAWMADFKAVGEMRGIGWAALVQDGWSGRLYNVWIEEHDGGHFAACPVLLLMDVFEHAYLVDNASKKAEYIDAFFRNVDWTTAERRLI
ncbi:MAG TPA: Fe-Mn family superoxide dismutase [Planctomycetota bacterium]|nr:Fe-Mn family superoxide dismutase [Planctomycetota bacterium]